MLANRWEKALSNALGETFPLAINLHCFCHVRGNFMSFLLNLGICETSTYLNEVFRKQKGDMYKGLLDACSKDDFDARLLLL